MHVSVLLSVVQVMNGSSTEHNSDDLQRSLACAAECQWRGSGLEDLG